MLFEITYRRNKEITSRKQFIQFIHRDIYIYIETRILWNWNELLKKEIIASIFTIFFVRRYKSRGRISDNSNNKSSHMLEMKRSIVTVVRGLFLVPEKPIPIFSKKTTISLYYQFPLWISPHDHHDGPLFFSSNLLLEFSDGFQCRSSGGVLTTMETIKKQSTFGENAKKEKKERKKKN